MELINKDILANAESAHKLLDGFLTRCHQGGFSTNDDLYDKMRSDKDPNVAGADTTYNILRRQLLQESGNRCCYCQRNINEESTTLEHTIPNKTATQEKYDEYQPYFSKQHWNKMEFAGAFLQRNRWPWPTYPHTIAYENLVPSCNGKFARSLNQEPHASDDRVSKCCNNKRGENFVVPFVFDSGMVAEFKYSSDGYVRWPVPEHIKGDERKRLLEAHKDTIDYLQLNCEELVAIRRIWFFLSCVQKNSDISEKERTIFYLTEDVNLTDNERKMLENFYQDNYWNLLQEYTYFNDISKFSK